MINPRDPHYGIPVCAPAFARIPTELRERMSNRFLDNETRYIGGSADTLYLPAHVVPSFVDVLRTFLNTSCFLEIAVPTTVHLVVPPEEDILFVDHVSIMNVMLVVILICFCYLIVVDMGRTSERLFCEGHLGARYGGGHVPYFPLG